MKRLIFAFAVLLCAIASAHAILPRGGAACPNPTSIGSVISISNFNCVLNPSGITAQSGWHFTASAFDPWGNNILTCVAGCALGGMSAILENCSLESGTCVFWNRQLIPGNADGTTTNYSLWFMYMNETVQASSSYAPLTTAAFVNNTSGARSQITYNQLCTAAVASDALEIATMPSGVPFYYDGCHLAADNVSITYDSGVIFRAYTGTDNGQGNTTVYANNVTLNGGTWTNITGASVGTWRIKQNAQNAVMENATISSCGTCIMTSGTNGQVSLLNMNISGGGVVSGGSTNQDHNIYLGMDVIDGGGPQTYNTTATWTGVTNSITLAGTTNVVKNLAIKGANIPAGTTITAISGATATLSQNTTGSGSSTPVTISDGDTCYNLSNVTTENVINEGWTLKLRPQCGVTARTTACSMSATAAGCVYNSTIGCAASWCSQNGVLDMPCGGNHIIAHSVIEKGPGSQASGYLVRYGEEVPDQNVAISSSSNQITVDATFSDISVGDDVWGSHIPANTLVTALSGPLNARVVTLNNNPTATMTDGVWWSNGGCPAWNVAENNTVTFDHDIFVDDGPNLSGWSVNNVICMGGLTSGGGICNNSGLINGYAGFTCTVTNSIIVSNGAAGSTALILGAGCTDGGGNTFYASRSAAGYAAFPYLPAPM